MKKTGEIILAFSAFLFLQNNEKVASAFTPTIIHNKQLSFGTKTNLHAKFGFGANEDDKNNLVEQNENESLIAPANDEERKRGRALRLMEVAQGEKRRQEQVSKDELPYAFLFLLQLLPLLGTARVTGVIYFLGVAVTTVYLGGRQETIDEPETVSKKNALAAPIGASIGLFFLYCLIQLGIDPTLIYAVIVTLFGALAISDIGVPILRNVLPNDFATKEIPLPKSLANVLELEESDASLPLDGLTTLLIGLLCTAVYWAPIAMTQKFIVSNAIAWAIAMVALGSVSFGSFQTGAILLLGLFAYDIFWVFKTDVMLTVATKVEAPVKFLYTAPNTSTRDYPFSVLGLGDVVIPGIFVRFMAKVDQALKPRVFSYFNVATFAYAFGLMLCFIANEITHSGQPALLYLDPACIGSALACGIANGQLKDVWNFELEPSSAEKEASENSG